MALVSPGVEVTIIDQSQYLPTASSSIPFLLVATAQNKINAAGTGVAAATTAANANKLYQITSQRDLVNLYGNPFFYKTTNGTPIQGYELNEYGLQAAYSLMGATNRAYILRADIDLGELVGSLSRPTGEPDTGTYWLDTTNSTWGIYEFSAVTGKFTNKVPMVLTDAASISGGYPKSTLGNVGDYAVIPLEAAATAQGTGTYFHKTRFNEWAIVGSESWQDALYIVQGSAGTFNIPANSTFELYLFNNGGNYTITTLSGSNTQTAIVDDIVSQINALSISGLTAYNINNNLAISLSAVIPYALNVDRPGSIRLTDGTGAPLALMGVLSSADGGARTFYQAEAKFGTSAQMPLWSSSQTYPRPSGSVWIKTSTAGNGIESIVSQYNSTVATWESVDVRKYISGAAALADLDSEGGKNVPEGTVFAQYSNANLEPNQPIIYWERLVTGTTAVVGGISNPTITGGLYLTVKVSDAGSATFTEYPTFYTSGGSTASFITDWQAANIADTDISINTDGQIEITHLNGGIIQLNDYDEYGQSTGLLEDIGFTPDYASNISYDTPTATTYTTVAQDDTSGTGGGFTATVVNYGGTYIVLSIGSGGSSYQIGDTITLSGALLGGSSPTNDLILNVAGLSGSTVNQVNVNVNSGTGRVNYTTQLSNWVRLDYIANEGTPAKLPLNGRKWFYSTATQVDIMVQKGGAWIGYKNTQFDSTGFPKATGTSVTDPLGPIMATDTPTTQTDGTALEYGDLWIDTNDLENYPMIYRWEQVDAVDQWVLIDNTDQTSSNGVLFADARWGSNGSINPVDDPIPTITSLLTSNYVDLDKPDPALYPVGMLLFNTRRSGYNVKEFKTGYFTGASFATAGSYDADDTTNIDNLPLVSYTWVSSSGLKTNGAAYMGRKAQRNLVVQAMKAAIGTNMSVREEDTFFNLISCPGYPELQPDMVVLNNDRNNTAYIVGDTPLRLADNATDIAAWATNKAGATGSGEDGWVTRDSYLGVYYPSGITTDYTGAQVVVPASHMMLRTFLRNDTVAYPWFAAAGTRRGNIDNATNIGYIDGATGEFVTVKNRMSIRDVLYTNQINPLAYFTGVGLLNYGNKNSFDSTSALDRTNVARLVAYIRDRVQIGARAFVFEPNDSLTRNQLAGVIQSLFIDLVAKRGIYDYLVVCDETNNTPARIDRNELWVDIAIEPVKAAEFIYIPVRIMNTGEISGT